MKYIIGIIAFGIVCFLTDRLGLWLENKGWLYYRHKKWVSRGTGGMFQEFNAILNPQVRHVAEAQVKNEEQVENRDAGSDDL